jgi:hypothetical protein
MNSLEKMIVEEISSMEELHLLDVLAFIRYLKMEKQGAPSEISGWFEHALKTIQVQAEELRMTNAAIQADIRDAAGK